MCLLLYGRFFSRPTICRAASAHSAPLLPTLPPARWMACSIVSQVSTPNNTGKFVSRPICVIALVTAAINVLVVCRFAADDGAEAENGGIAVRRGQALGDERDFHRARNPGDVDRVVGDVVLFQLRDGAIEQFACDRFVPAGDDDGEAVGGGG